MCGPSLALRAAPPRLVSSLRAEAAEAEEEATSRSRHSWAAPVVHRARREATAPGPVSVPRAWAARLGRRRPAVQEAYGPSSSPASTSRLAIPPMALMARFKTVVAEGAERLAPVVEPEAATT